MFLYMDDLAYFAHIFILTHAANVLLSQIRQAKEER